MTNEVKIMNGAAEVLVLKRNMMQISETRQRENMVTPIQYTSTVMGMDLIATAINLNISGELYIFPQSDYATVSDILDAFRATMPDTSMELSLTDDDAVYSLSNILVTQFKVDANQSTPNGVKYSMQIVGITEFLG